MARLIGGPVQKNKEKARKASPFTYVDKEPPRSSSCTATKTPRAAQPKRTVRRRVEEGRRRSDARRRQGQRPRRTRLRHSRTSETHRGVLCQTSKAETVRRCVTTGWLKNERGRPARRYECGRDARASSRNRLRLRPRFHFLRRPEQRLPQFGVEIPILGRLPVEHRRDADAVGKPDRRCLSRFRAAGHRET